MIEKITDILLKLVSLLSIVVCIVITVTYGRTVFNSDTSIASLFAKCTINSHSLFSETWSYANGDMWTVYPAVGILSTLVSPFLGYGDLARAVVVVLQMLIGCSTVVFLSRKYYIDKSWIVALPLGTIYLSGVSFYILYDGCYGDFLIWEPLICILAIKLFRKFKDNKYISLELVSIFLLLYVMTIRGPRTIADFTLPLVIAAIVFLYVDIVDKREIDVKQTLKYGIYVGVSTLLPSIFGLATYTWLSKWHTINNVKQTLMVFSGNMENVFQGFIKCCIFYFDIFGYESGVSVASLVGLRNFISIIMCIFVCFIVPFLQAKRIFKETKAVQFIFFYTIAHNTIFFLCGVFFDFVISYHLISSVVLFVLVSSRYIYNYWIKQSNRIRGMAWTYLFIVATLIECLCLASNFSGWRSRLDSKREVANILVAHELTKGYGTFWNAYINSLYSKGKIEFGAVIPVENKLQEYWWLVDNSVYEDDFCKSFIILTDEELAERDYDWDIIIYGYEVPIEEFVIPDVLCYSDTHDEYRTNLNVYVYENDYARYLVNGSNDGIVEPNEMSFNWYGTKDYEKITMYRDGYVYGPYSNIDKGKYIVTYTGQGLLSCAPSIISENNQDYIDYSIVKSEDMTITIELDISSRVEGIQFTLYNLTDKVVYLNKITVERL